ncbi:MAG: class I SAM-dependent methyltransferase [Sphaerochaeta sp.]
MRNTTSATPIYRNWVSTKLIVAPGILALGTAVLTASYSWIMIFPFLFLLMMLYFIYARYLFSPAGKNMQGELQSMLLEEVVWDGRGKALDIGCGNGALAIRLAKKYPEASVYGIEYRGFREEVCKQNALLEGVAQRVTCIGGSIIDLPFEDEEFALVVSNLTFHEVKDLKDRRELMEEALRVLKDGGLFVFQDLFLTKKMFGNLDPMLNKLASWGAKSVEFVNTSESERIPSILRTPFMVGTIGIIKGKV